MATDRNRPYGVHTIHSVTQPGTQCEFAPGAWGPVVAEPYDGNRLVAAWWVLTGRAYAMIWPTSGELNAAIGTPIPKQR